jgi:hypothetical protein
MGDSIKLQEQAWLTQDLYTLRKSLLLAAHTDPERLKAAQACSQMGEDGQGKEAARLLSEWQVPMLPCDKVLAEKVLASVRFDFLHGWALHYKISLDTKDGTQR